MGKESLKIGVLGVGHLGSVHLNCLQSTPFEVVGFYDPNDEVAINAIEKFDLKRFSSPETLIKEVDAVDIVTPTTFHYEMARLAMDSGRHVFIEKPVTTDHIQALTLVQLAEEKELIAQVGHVERYNPAFLSIKKRPLLPRFIEAHRLAMFNNRGNDVSVIMDLMIHDLDLILSVVNDDVVEIRANGVPVINKTADICNARLTFKKGCVANITASRISLKNMRKIRMFQEDAYVSVDFLEKESQIVSMENVDDADDYNGEMIIRTGDQTKIIHMEMPKVIENNAIVQELHDFYDAIVHHKTPLVSIRDGYRALILAEEIEKEMNKNLNNITH